MRFVFLVLILFPEIAWDRLAKIREGIQSPKKSLITFLVESSSFKALSLKRKVGSCTRSIDF